MANYRLANCHNTVRVYVIFDSNSHRIMPEIIFGAISTFSEMYSLLTSSHADDFIQKCLLFRFSRQRSEFKYEDGKN